MYRFCSPKILPWYLLCGTIYIYKSQDPLPPGVNGFMDTKSQLLILFDQATIQKNLIPKFKSEVEEGLTYVFENFMT